MEKINIVVGRILQRNGDIVVVEEPDGVSCYSLRYYNITEESGEYVYDNY